MTQPEARTTAEQLKANLEVVGFTKFTQHPNFPCRRPTSAPEDPGCPQTQVNFTVLVAAQS